MRLFVALCLTVTAVLAETTLAGYHARVGIPLAARIKEAELVAVQEKSRIIGGQPAPLGAHPYLVGLIVYFVNGQMSVCGSSMLSNTRAVTAAHCWSDGQMQSELFTLVFGSEHIFIGGVRVNSSDVELHPEWDNSFLNVQYDIAVIRFNHVAYTDIIQPISLPSGGLESSKFVGVWAQASGYGLTGEGAGLQPNQVQSHVTVQVISNEVCHQTFPSSIVTEKILCTSGAGPVGVCSSDSGGPLSIIDNNQRVLIGVTSFGSIRCESGAPSGFVRVTSHLAWIRALL